MKLMKKDSTLQETEDACKMQQYKGESQYHAFVAKLAILASQFL